MEALEASSKRETERNPIPANYVGRTKNDSHLVSAFFSDPQFVEATREGIRRIDAGDAGISLEDLRREISESSTLR